MFKQHESDLNNQLIHNQVKKVYTSLMPQQILALYYPAGYKILKKKFGRIKTWLQILCICV